MHCTLPWLVLCSLICLGFVLVSRAELSLFLLRLSGSEPLLAVDPTHNTPACASREADSLLFPFLSFFVWLFQTLSFSVLFSTSPALLLCSCFLSLVLLPPCCLLYLPCRSRVHETLSAHRHDSCAQASVTLNASYASLSAKNRSCSLTSRPLPSAVTRRYVRRGEGRETKKREARRYPNVADWTRSACGKTQ